jgi:hypothetical protein
MPKLDRPFLFHTLIVVGLVGLSILVSSTVPRNARLDADTWLQGLTPKAQTQLETFSQVKGSDLERARLKDQLALSRERAKHHLTVAVYFFSNYYMAILEAFVMGAIAAVALFFITKVGYAQASPYVVTVFITATVLAAVYGAFPSVFRQSDNVAENKALYLRYIALQNEMLSYSATGLDGTGKKVTAAEYIAYVDKEFNKANNIAVGFDATKIPAIKFDLK